MTSNSVAQEVSARPVIYDFGMNNGDDVDYYLHKGARVVGVEANPDLCNEVRARFPREIAARQLSILNVALSDVETSEPVTFYVHKHNHVLSRLPEPRPEVRDQFTAIQVPCRTPASIVREFGDPLYVKIDLEFYDQQVLKNLFGAGIYPPEISAESHTIDVFAHLVVNGYRSFSLVDGSSVAREYGNAVIATPAGPQTYQFRHHSAGPYGEDIRAPWEDAETFFHTLAIAGLGWKDIHASREIPPSPAPSNIQLAARQARGLLQRVRTSLWWRTVGRFRSS